MMKRKWLLAVIVVVVLVGVSYGTYAVDYKGNYNVKVQFNATLTASMIADQGVSVDQVVIVSSPTDALQFWQQLKGHQEAVSSYWQVFLEFTQGGKQDLKTVSMGNLTSADIGFSKSFSATFDNKPAGDATVHIWSLIGGTQTKSFDHTYPLVVGA